MHFESFRAVRRIRTVNMVLQALLFTSFFGGLNYLAIHYSWRFDLTRAHRYSLSPETKSYLKNLARPVRVIVTIGDDFPDSEMAGDIKGLLREYAFATEAGGGDNRITVEYLDVYQRPREARELDIQQPDSIFFMCGEKGEKRRGIMPTELYRVESGEKKEFKGEQVFTAAFLDVSAPEQKKIYFLTGHGELSPDDPNPMTGVSKLKDELRIRNFAVEMLDLGYTRKVPDDASLVIAAAPELVEPFAQEQLRQYLSNRAGRAILMLATRRQHGLNALLDEWGVWVHDVVICDSNPENITEEHDLRINCFTPHPITQTLIDRDLPLRIGETLCVNPFPDKIKGSGLTLTQLAASSTTAWGEKSYRTQRPYVYDEGIDLKGNASTVPQYRLGIAVASERIQARGNLPFSVRGGRLVVFGSADIAVNNRIAGSPGAQAIFLNAVNWAVDRDTQLAIPPRPIEKFQLALSQEDISRLRTALWFGLPAVVACFGFAVYWTRRN
ncbi:MAG: GldG family protein [Opitutaceae bacterium]|jgi:hypothetical protein